MNDLTLYAWATPNSRRVAILFEELAIDYRVTAVNIRNREQFAPAILELNPFGKVPIVVWQERGHQRVMFESGAILLYFAETFGALLPSVPEDRAEVLCWLSVVLTSLAPASGQAHHWSTLAAEKSPPALQHSVALVERVYRLLDERLADRQYLAGAYSIADIAAFPWIGVSSWTTLALATYPKLQRWYRSVAARPAVKRGVAQPYGVSL